MDRSLWLSLLALGLGIAVLLTSRAALDGEVYLRGTSLAAEIESLQGAPSSQDLADRTTEAAGCIYGNQPRVRTCWHAWAHPSVRSTWPSSRSASILIRADPRWATCSAPSPSGCLSPSRPGRPRDRGLRSARA